MDKQEKIVCAAISCRYIHEKGGIASIDVPGVDWDSIRLSKLFKGIYHANEFLSFDKGFLTNKNRFVDPTEAQKIAIACGQYKDPHIQIRLLEESIEIGWHSLERARTGVLKHTMRNELAKDQKRLDELKAGYLGYELRVEDLHYVSS